VIRRGDIWWAGLPDPAGSEPGFRHPVVILQSNEFNRSRINTVVAVVITSNLRLSDAPGNIHLPKQQGRLPRDSVINVSQIVTIDKTCLLKKVCSLPGNLLYDLEEGIRLVLALERK
jgi:mRNA interferase MazF